MKGATNISTASRGADRVLFTRYNVGTTQSINQQPLPNLLSAVALCYMTGQMLRPLPSRLFAPWNYITSFLSSPETLR